MSDNNKEVYLKNLGRKAKFRLHQERTKRPEIVRLDTAAKTDNQATKQFPSFFFKPNKKQAVARPRKRQKRTADVSNPDRRAAVDAWIPSLPDNDCTSDNKSRLVCLHGVPVGTTARALKRFFSGLTPLKVLLLPSQAVPVALPGLDASHASRQTNTHTLIERYPASLRIFVLFDSAPTAALATQRSGETLLVDDESGGKGASLAVTIVPKPIATHFLKHMTIEAPPLRALHEFLNEVERELDGRVLDLLWSQAEEELDLESMRSRKPAKGFSFTVLSPQHYKLANKHRNQLVDTLQTMRYQLPFPLSDLLDPAWTRDPVIRLTMAATNRLEAMIWKLDEDLHRSRLLPKLHQRSKQC